MLIKLGLIIILVIFTISLLASQNASPNFPPLFGLKRVQEKSFLSLQTSSEDKLDYMLGLQSNRLSELSTVVKNQNYEYVLGAASRYSSLAGEITDIVLTSHNDKKAEVKKIFENHQKTLKELYQIYPKNTDNLEYKYIEDDINYLKIYMDKLSSN